MSLVGIILKIALYCVMGTNFGDAIEEFVRFNDLDNAPGYAFTLSHRVDVDVVHFDGGDVIEA